MGTQQILMIVLSVIVVGAAVAVGIQMFDTQANNAARQAMAADIVQMGSQAQAWYRTPKMMGGAGNDSTMVKTANLDAISKYMDSQATDAVIDNANGSYTVSIATGSVVQIAGVAASDATIYVNGAIKLTESGPDGIKVNPNAPDATTFPSFE